MNKRKKHSITILLIIMLITLLSVVGCTTKQEYVIQYLDDNQDMVTEVYTTLDSINHKAHQLDSLGINYWIE